LKPFDEKQQEEAKEAMTLESVIALKDINLSIRHGEFVCVIGDVGSGKSSLLNAIIGDLLYLDSTFLDSNRNLNVNEEDAISAVKKAANKRHRHAPIEVS
jgi:ABC-type nitrate/sulfonate/bicarbonate transport system ATPase subunit